MKEMCGSNYVPIHEIVTRMLKRNGISTMALRFSLKVISIS